MKLSRILVSSVLAAIILPGCDDDDAEDTGATDGATEGDVEMVTLGGVIAGFAEQAPVAGAQICIHQMSDIPCATSADDGTYELPGVPPNTELTVVITATDHMPGALWITTGDMPEQGAGLSLLSNAARILFEQAVDTDFDDSKAHIAITADDGMGNGVPGVTFSMTPNSGILAYIDQNSLPDTTLTETVQGTAGYANVDGSEVQLTFTHATGACTLDPLVPTGGAPNTARLGLLPGHFNSIYSPICE